MNICHDFRFGKIMYNVLDEFVGKSLKLYGEFSYGEVELFEMFIKPGDIIVEAGANIGSLTVPIAQMAGNTGKVYAFEPQRLVFQLLAGNLALNSIVNTYAINKGLSSKPGTALVPVLSADQVHNWGGVSLKEEHPGAQMEEVEITTIDSLGLPALKFLKIDVEGMALEVIKGGRKTIARHRPVIYMEVEGNEEDEGLVAEVKRMEYRVYAHTPNLYNPDNYFHNHENAFVSFKRNDSGRIVEQVEIASFNALCVHRGSGYKVDGLKEL